MVLTQQSGTKKQNMHKILTIGFSVLLFLDAAASYLCIYCHDVQEDNTCTHPEQTCQAGLWRYCFSQKVIRGGITMVTRGCSSTCRSIKSNTQEEQMLCCEKNLCNKHDLWRKYKKG
ncbi:neurotoxin BM10-1-like [Heteronotia binoei]|uniref:neurotoxin BM10-1-like n=1 Tax=Heteronotia binoei TaxID=13085 RepID=UPI00292EDABA|nr:neurotoxin BM10-1-like [Heteronotia binoei]